MGHGEPYRDPKGPALSLVCTRSDSTRGQPHAGQLFCSVSLLMNYCIAPMGCSPPWACSGRWMAISEGETHACEGAHQLLHVGSRGLHIAPQLVVQREHQESLLHAKSWEEGQQGLGLRHCVVQVPSLYPLACPMAASKVP